MSSSFTRSIVAIAALVSGLFAGPAAQGTTFTDGQFYSYEPEIWGYDPSDGPPASLFVPGVAEALNFYNMFPNNITIGGHFTLVFSVGTDILDFLPQTGPPGVLTYNSEGSHAPSPGGRFAGNVLALFLNVTYGDLDSVYDTHGRLVTTHPAASPSAIWS